MTQAVAFWVPLPPAALRGNSRAGWAGASGAAGRGSRVRVRVL